VSLLPPDVSCFLADRQILRDRQLAVDETVVIYLTTRIERSFAPRDRLSNCWTRGLRLGRPVTGAGAELLRNA